MALTLGTHDLDSAPTPITAGRSKGRTRKSFEEQVQEADAIPYDPASTAGGLDSLDTGEVPMTAEQEAEFKARARMGLGGPQEAAESPRTFVTDYDAKGEAIDVEIAPRAPQQPISPPMTSTGNQYVMPMFEGLTMDNVIINLAGRVEQLDLGRIIDGRVVGRRSGPGQRPVQQRCLDRCRSHGLRSSGLQRLALLGAVQAFQTMLPKLL